MKKVKAKPYHKSIFTKIKNFFFCLKYPFWKMYKIVNGKFMGYTATEYDAIPDGWRITFGKQLSDELKQVVKEEQKRAKKETGKKPSVREVLYFTQIKEKYGTLRLYAHTTSKIHDILYKYENLSAKYCINCGQPAEYKTEGWVEYLCERCFLELIGKTQKFKTEEEIFDYMNYCSINKKGE